MTKSVTYGLPVRSMVTVLSMLASCYNSMAPYVQLHFKLAGRLTGITERIFLA